MLPGCAGSPNEQPSSLSSATASAMFGEYLAAAVDGGADDDQLEVLRDAVATGELSFETVDELIQRTFACLDAAGIGHVERAPTEVVPGYVVHSYSLSGQAPGMTEDQTRAIADACSEKHSQFAAMARTDTRAYQQLWEAHVADRLPLIVECLEQHGVDIDPDATADEVLRAADDLLAETGAVGDGDQAVFCKDALQL